MTIRLDPAIIQRHRVDADGPVNPPIKSGEDHDDCDGPVGQLLTAPGLFRNIRWLEADSEFLG
jgi:hypothetical protein